LFVVDDYVSVCESVELTLRRGKPWSAAHRGKMIEKMGAGSLPELVRMAAKLCLPSAPGKNDQIDRSPSVRPFLRPRQGEGHTAYALAGP